MMPTRPLTPYISLHSLQNVLHLFPMALADRENFLNNQELL